MEICLDFDGTCVSHEFPKIGKDIGAIPVLKDLVKAGHKLILFTMRSDKPNQLYLHEAVNWFKQNDIPLHGINENPQQKEWTTSPKAYGQLYIDDAALGVPLKQDKCPEFGVCNGAGNCIVCGGSGYIDRPYVDWQAVRKILQNTKVMPKQ